MKQGQKLNSEGKQDEALMLYNQAPEKSPNSYEAHLESDVALDLKGDYAAASEHLKKAPSLAVRDSSGPPEPPLPAMRRNVYSATLGGPLIGSRVGRKSNRNSLARPQSRIFSRSPNRAEGNRHCYDSVPSTLQGHPLEGHVVRNSVVIVNVKHAFLHADHFVAVVSTAVVLPALKITVEAVLIFT